MKRIFDILSLLLIIPALFLPGCGDASSSLLPGDDEIRENTDVKLSLTVSIGEPMTERSSTRTFTTDGNDPFEKPVTVYEKASTLRIIIVRPGGIVEHNRKVALDDKGNPVNDNLEFTVTGGEKKRIYIFANEAKVSYNFDEIHDNAIFPEKDVADLLLSREAGKSFIDNTSDDKEYIPMSEFFDVYVIAPTEDVNRRQNAKLFVTRSLIKFSFSLSVDNDAALPESGINITSIRVGDLANSCYFLPHDTEYDPGKYTESSRPLSGREITSFSTPVVNDFSPYVFNLSSPFAVTPGNDKDYPEYIYFPESKLMPGKEKFTVSIIMDGDYPAWFDPKPLEITSIPRNTHVKVNIRIKKTEIVPEVVLLPYTGVTLNPSFGL